MVRPALLDAGAPAPDAGAPAAPDAHGRLCAIWCLERMIEGCVPAGTCDGLSSVDGVKCLADILQKTERSLPPNDRREITVRRGAESCFTATLSDPIGGYQLTFTDDRANAVVAAGKWDTPMTVSCVRDPQQYNAASCLALYGFLGIFVLVR